MKQLLKLANFLILTDTPIMLVPMALCEYLVAEAHTGQDPTMVMAVVPCMADKQQCLDNSMASSDTCIIMPVDRQRSRHRAQ